MQRWKFAVGAVVLTLAVGPVAGCSKGSSAKQTATQAKGKSDPKAANAAKPAGKSAQAPANAQKGSADTKSPAPAKKAEGKPAQTAAAAKPTPAKAPAPAAPAAAAKPASSPAAATAANAPFGETQQELQSNKALVAAIQPRVPAGTDVVKASLGFRNVQHFVAAVHASQNLGIPLDKLRSAIVDEKKSLSQAIRTLKPSASATIEAQRADYDARGTIYQSKQTPATATAAESAAKKPAKASAKPKASSN